MSRRRLTRQQKARIAAIRERRLQQAQHKTDTLPDKHDETPRDGTVVVRHGRSLVIADEERHLVNCRFRQNLGDIVCGDIQPLGMHMQFGGGQGGYIGLSDSGHGTGCRKTHTQDRKSVV